MKHSLIAVSIACILSSLSCGTAGAKPSDNAKFDSSDVEFQCLWPAAINPTQVTLKAEIGKVKGMSTEGVLRVFRDDDLVFSHDPGFGLCPCSMFPLSDGNLATVWETGMGSYFHLFVFSYSAATRKVRLVLHTVSDGMQPEFVYQTEGHVMGEMVKDKNGKLAKLAGGPFFQQRIIVPNTEWVVLKEADGGSERHDKQPITADIYCWDEKAGKYSVRSKVPWRERLQGL